MNDCIVKKLTLTFESQIIFFTFSFRNPKIAPQRSDYILCFWVSVGVGCDARSLASSTVLHCGRSVDRYLWKQPAPENGLHGCTQPCTASATAVSLVAIYTSSTPQLYHQLFAVHPRDKIILLCNDIITFLFMHQTHETWLASRSCNAFI